jgi:hypothetical protein
VRVSPFIRPQDADVPLLVVDDVSRDAGNPDRLASAIRVAGHPLRIVLDFGRRDMNFIEFVEVPDLLAMHAPSLQAVVDLMTRVDGGQTVKLPADLSEHVRKSPPPSPFLPLTATEQAVLESAAAAVAVDVLAMERTASEPAHFNVRLRIDGRPIALHVQLYAGPRRIPVMRWIGGPDPESMPAAQRYAILRALVRVLEERTKNPDEG